MTEINKFYGEDVPLDQAWERYIGALQSSGLWESPIGEEVIPLNEQGVGRVLVDSAWAQISSPHYHAAAMDGFAVRSRETVGAAPSAPITLSLQWKYVDTGDPLPDWADAIIPIENVEAITEDGRIAINPRNPYAIRIRSGVTPWQHVRSMGEDIVSSQLVFPAGHVLRPVDLGALAACGHHRLRVARRVRVAILPTGTELVPIGTHPEVGDIIEFNSIVLAGQVNNWGGEAIRYKSVPDEFDTILKALQNAARNADLVLIIAGSSAGSEDYSAKVIETLGQVYIHGIAVRPGHPVILGVLRVPESADGISSKGSELETRTVPVIGMPGYPVSAALTSEIFVERLLAHWLGRQPHEPAEVDASLTRTVTSPGGDDDYMRVVVGRVEGKLVAAPLSRGAGVITSLVNADGITIVPRGIQGISAGELVRVRLYRPMAEIERTILAIGSHDIALDLVSQYLMPYRRRLVSSNVGSLGGLIALRRGESHLAGSHLLDPETGEYNLVYINQYLPSIPVVLINFVQRIQGLIVKRGNPLGIKTLPDLINPEVRFVNRQRGAGTRVLLDYHLKLLDITPSTVVGYEQEEYTHLAVAAAVASGKADVGLGITAAALALDLDFIPLFEERYDLVVSKQGYQSPLVSPVWDILNDNSFRNAVAGMPGYNTARMGEIIAEID